MFATFLVVALSVANAWRVPTMLARTDNASAESTAALARPSTDVAAFLMAVRALLASMAIRAGEHPVTARSVASLPVLTLIAVAVPLVQGWLLAFRPNNTADRTIWVALTALSVLLSVLVTMAYRGPQPVTT